MEFRHDGTELHHIVSVGHDVCLSTSKSCGQMLMQSPIACPRASQSPWWPCQSLGLPAHH
eukprot:5902669-Amphidinium_carterae.1